MEEERNIVGVGLCKSWLKIVKNGGNLEFQI